MNDGQLRKRRIPGPVAEVAMVVGLALGTARADTLLLSDNYNSESYGVSTFNDTLATDQAGTLATVTYTVAGYKADYKIQHGNTEQMLIAGWHAGEGADLYSSLNHNFADEAGAANKPLVVRFDLKITDSSDPSNWATIAIGSSQNAFVVDGANKFSSLFRHNGGTQQFASGGDISSGATWNAAGSTITVILSDTAGTGSPFNGSGSVVRMYVNGVPAGTYTLAQMAGSDGYVSVQGNAVFALYDNLSVSLMDPAAVTWSAPVAMAGDTDVSTSGSLVYAYTESGAGATVNGVAFAAGNSTTSLGGGNVTLMGFDGGVDTGTYIGGNPVGLSTDYQTVVRGGAYNNGETAAVTLHNLVTGRDYEVQFWVCDYREWPPAVFARSETLSAGNTSGALTYLQTDGSGNNLGGPSGTYVIGTFTANGASQTITLYPDASAQMNAVQLRQMVDIVSGDGYFDAASAAVWDSGAALDWASVSGGPYDKAWGQWSIAHFEGAGGGVTINGQVDANGVIFDVDGYSLNGGTLHTGSPVGGPHVTVNATSATIASSITDTGAAIIKDGTGSLELTGNNTHANGTTIDAGTLVAARSMQDNGIHTLGSGPLTINNGGTLRTTANWVTSSEWNDTSVGSITVNLGGTWSIEAVGMTIRNGLYMNGGTISGTTENADWGALHLKNEVTAGGGVTSTIAADTALNWGRTITVEDGSELDYSGKIHDQVSGSFPGAVQGAITKAGNGTLTLSGANTYTGTTTVNAGVLRLGATDTLTSANALVLSGGALDADAFSNSLGTLDVTAASRLTFGSGSLSFADSSAAGWTGTLALVGTLGPTTVRFGDSLNALTTDQLQKISLDGHPVDIDANGYLTKASQGTLFIIR